MNRRVFLAAALSVAALAPSLAVRQAVSDDRGDYVSANLVHGDAVEKFQKRLAAGAAALKFEGRPGYLRSVLRALGISSSSQMLVFSKTSLQIEKIGPKTPRAIYFNDDTYVAWTPGAPFLEVASMDSVHGAILYVIKNEPQESPEFIRQTFACLSCHGGSRSEGVPGVMMRSVYPSSDGQPMLQRGSYLTSDASPMAERWGGWYVTGTHGGQRHMGNVTVEGATGVASPSVLPDAGAYLTPHSDIVALTVAAHQMRVQNLLTRANQGVRSALRDMAVVHPDLQPGEISESAASRIRSVCEPVADALCMKDESSLAEPIRGTSRFAAEYSAAGPRDSQGRSLRELDLATRLFKYRVSPMVYSRGLASLPPEGRDTVLAMLRARLEGKVAGEILSETLTGYKK